MAFRPSLWGLHVWITGEDIILLDEKGYVCSTKNKLLAFALVGFESKFGPGALRVVLKRSVLDPLALVRKEAPKYNPKASVPFAKTSPEVKLRRRKLSPADFLKLLGEI